jgi:hypothetical protein
MNDGDEPAQRADRIVDVQPLGLVEGLEPRGQVLLCRGCAQGLEFGQARRSLATRCSLAGSGFAGSGVTTTASGVSTFGSVPIGAAAAAFSSGVSTASSGSSTTPCLSMLANIF